MVMCIPGASNAPQVLEGASDAIATNLCRVKTAQNPFICSFSSTLLGML